MRVFGFVFESSTTFDFQHTYVVLFMKYLYKLCMFCEAKGVETG